MTGEEQYIFRTGDAAAMGLFAANLSETSEVTKQIWIWLYKVCVLFSLLGNGYEDTNIFWVYSHTYLKACRCDHCDSFQPHFTVTVL